MTVTLQFRDFGLTCTAQQRAALTRGFASAPTILPLVGCSVLLAGARIKNVPEALSNIRSVLF